MIWELVALPLIAALALAHTAIDRWLFNQPRPLARRAVGVLAARWAFLATVLIYAWLIDSHRIPYSEPGIWGLFAGGMTLTVGLVLNIWKRP